MLVYVAASFAFASDPAKHRSISAASSHVASGPPCRSLGRTLLTNRPFIATVCCTPVQLDLLHRPPGSTSSSSRHGPTRLRRRSPSRLCAVCGALRLRILLGFVADKLESRARLSPTMTRKLINSIGFGGAAGLALGFVAPTGTPLLRGRQWCAAVCLSVAIGVAGFGAAAGYAAFATCPRHGALLLAISNARVGAKIIGNTFTGNLLSRPRTTGALWISAGTLVLGALFYLGSEARDQQFDTPRVGSLNTKLLDVGVDDADREAAGAAGAASSSAICDGENITPPPTYRPD